MKYKYILFDLDGTVTDPKIGITKSVKYALSKYDITVNSLDELESFIGPPLKDSFMEFYGFTEEKAIKSIDYYREYFKDKGIFENEKYENIELLLKTLKSNGCSLTIATSKPTIFANIVIEHFNLNQYFDFIIGSNLDGTLSNKAEIITYAIKKLNIKNKKDVVMIGDRKHDIIGAKKNNIDSIGVLYGYGSLDEITAVNPTYIINDLNELSKLLI